MILIVLSVLIALLLLLVTIHTARRIFYRLSPPPVVAPTPSNPQVVVNVPKDYKPLETLDGKEVVVGEKALLWWTVYKHTLLCIDDIDCYDITKAVWAADNAVDKVYGAENNA